MVTVTMGSLSASTCYCGSAESTAECLGVVINDDGTILWDCEPNGCSTCVTSTLSSGLVCWCY